MKKRLFPLLLLFLICFSAVVYGAEQQSAALTQTGTESSPKKGKIKIPKPISEERKNIDGTEYLIKLFEPPEGFDPNYLIENGFEQDGFLFAHYATKTQPNEKKDTKEVTDTITIQTQTNNREGILKRLPVTLEYNKENYIGVLNLNTDSIQTSVNGYTTKNATISAVKDYPGLMYADPSYVPQSISKDGHTLPLVNVDWVVMGTGLAGDSLVPTEYKATASYSKTISSQVPTGYTTTASYIGTATKTELGLPRYEVTYAGTPLMGREPVPEKKGMVFPWKVLIGCLLFFAVIGGCIFLVLFLKSRKGVQIFNLIDKEYICLGRQAVDYGNPIVDLNEFKDMIESNSFTFVIDKSTTNKLFGKNISVTLEDVTVKHMVKGYNEEYQFHLELGGVLDVE